MCKFYLCSRSVPDTASNFSKLAFFQRFSKYCENSEKAKNSVNVETLRVCVCAVSLNVVCVLLWAN